MKRPFIQAVQNQPIHKLVLMYISCISIGVLISAILRWDGNWLGWSFSALGEGENLSSFAFNGAILLSTTLLWAITDKMYTILNNSQNKKAAQLTLWCFRLMCLCLVIVGLFPNDTHREYHLLGARGLLVIFTLYILALPVTIKSSSLTMRIMSYIVPVLSLMLSLHGFVQKQISFVVYETLMGGLIFIWFFMFCWFLQKNEEKM